MLDIFSASECQEIVRNTLKLAEQDVDNVEILDFVLKRGPQELVGFMGEYYKLVISIADKRLGRTAKQTNLNYFVKSVPHTNSFLKEECEGKRIFEKEALLYTKVLSNLQRYATVKLAPACYYTRKDLLVLEDLSLEYQHMKAGVPYTMQHYKIVLRQLAELHAASIAWEDNEGICIADICQAVQREMMLSRRNEWYLTGAKGIVYLAQRHSKFQNEIAQKYIAAKLYDVLYNVEDLMDLSKDLRNVFCHRDAWDRNILYRFNRQGEPTACSLVDFQLSRCSPPAVDVLFHLYTTTPAPVRRSISDDCLAYYFQCLQQRFIELHIDAQVITSEDFAVDCKRARLAALIIWAISEPLIRMPEGLSMKMRAENPQKFDYYMNVDRHELFERVMVIDKNYRDIIMTPVEELLDYLLANETS